MWRKILKGKHVPAEERNDCFGRRSANEFGKGLNNRQQFFCGFIIVSENNKRAAQNSLQFRNQ
jgi:hypothetical protein